MTMAAAPLSTPAGASATERAAEDCPSRELVDPFTGHVTGAFGHNRKGFANVHDSITPPPHHRCRQTSSVTASFGPDKRSLP
ncbi:hypothetical protein GCM10022224_006210 [Nonomuraea antimicrobica]|uniref:Uncharacterized protein n=1 Tax=Nonomuraea antimicrobica TaxID=561173 RepID=A0ABP7B1M7_9ACTN